MEDLGKNKIFQKKNAFSYLVFFLFYQKNALFGGVRDFRDEQEKPRGNCVVRNISQHSLLTF